MTKEQFEKGKKIEQSLAHYQERICELARFISNYKLNRPTLKISEWSLGSRGLEIPAERDIMEQVLQDHLDYYKETIQALQSEFESL